MKIVATAVALLCVALSSAQSGWYRYRVFPKSDADVQRVTDCPLGLFSDYVAKGETDLIVGPGELVELWKLRIPYRLVSDLPDPRNWEGEFRADADYRTTYLTYDEIIAQYEVWRAQWPQYISRQAIGTSIQGRTIWAYRVFMKIRGADQSMSFIAVNGIHAREWISPAVGMHVFYRIARSFAIGERGMLQYLRPGVAYYFIPSLNPDGYAYTWSNNRMWRKNRRNNGNGTTGVDLNRNFSKGWGGTGSSGNGNSETYRGTAALSEPETQAVTNFADTLPGVIGFIDFHSYSQLILWPWGYTTATAPGDAWLGATGNAMRNAILAASGSDYIAGPAASTLYVASGTTEDYFYDRYNAVSYTVELRDTGEFGFLLPADQITPTQDEIWEAFKHFSQRMQNR